MRNKFSYSDYDDERNQSAGKAFLNSSSVPRALR